MAHIASCIASLESGSPSNLSPLHFPMPPSMASPPATPEKPPGWRTSQKPKQQELRFLLQEKQLPSLTPGRNNKTDKSTNPTLTQTGPKFDTSVAGTKLRLRMNQRNRVRRRKITMPDLSPMTTVHEVAMDSPTIPGRLPFDENLRSDPEPASKHKIQYATEPVAPTDDIESKIPKAFEEIFKPLEPATSISKDLAHLFVPNFNASAPLLRSRCSAVNSISSLSPVDKPLPGRIDLPPSSWARLAPNASTPELTFPKYTAADRHSAPKSAPLTDYHRRPYPSSPAALSAPLASHSPRAAQQGAAGLHNGGLSDTIRRASESSVPMNKGISSPRSDLRLHKPQPSRPTAARRTKSIEERKAFEELPQGFKLGDVTSKITATELISIKKQARYQTERFEVLRQEDVDTLSKELRQLDERTEYLRRTYISLRAGRRSLHSRICQYLRSPRVARFSVEAMLKQEEALAELDASIDDWFMKLEQAENRSTRVRQKLLEHVAAAVLLLVPGSSSHTGQSVHSTAAAKSPGPCDLSTPPRSPLEASFPEEAEVGSPSAQPVVSQVFRSLSKHSGLESTAEPENLERRPSSLLSLSGTDAESIRIYFGEDVCALVNDVRSEISKLSSGSGEQTQQESSQLERPQRERHRSQ